MYVWVLEIVGIFLPFPRLPRTDAALFNWFSCSPTCCIDHISTLHVLDAVAEEYPGLFLLKAGRLSLKPPTPSLPEGAWEVSPHPDQSLLGPHPCGTQHQVSLYTWVLWHWAAPGGRVTCFRTCLGIAAACASWQVWLPQGGCLNSSFGCSCVCSRLYVKGWHVVAISTSQKYSTTFCFLNSTFLTQIKCGHDGVKSVSPLPGRQHYLCCTEKQKQREMKSQVFRGIRLSKVHLSTISHSVQLEVGVKIPVTIDYP